MSGLEAVPDLRSEPVDAQRNAVQRLQGKSKLSLYSTYPKVARRLALGSFVAAYFVLLPVAWGAVGGPRPGPSSGKDIPESAARLSKISGVVRDAQGVVQMGALVQVLTGNEITVATAFTDRNGHYSIPNLNPGRYLVRASGTLFVPVTRANLQLRTGATAVVNLTMAALYDTAAWLPAQRRRADESPDDWKWTLRSTANRPILRIVDDGSAIEVSSGETKAPAAIRVKARAAVESGDGGFGQGGVHSIVTLHEGLANGSDVMLRADLGSSGFPGTGSGQTGNEFDAGFESRTGFGGASRTVVSYQSHPELIGAGMASGGAGLAVMEMTSAQRMTLGENVEFEAGGRMEAVRMGATAVAAHPFVRLIAHPTGEWTLEYQLASDQALQSFDDVTGGDSEVPVALVRNGRLELESARHEEISAARRTAGASVQVAFYEDRFNQTAISGGMRGTATTPWTSAAVDGSALPVGVLVDPTTGTFRALTGAYTSDGARITASSTLSRGLWIAAEYATGEALDMGTVTADAEPVGLAQALGALKAHRAQTATLALKGHLLGSGTRVRASYRWQPTEDVTAVDAFSAFADQSFFSCMVRQPIRFGRTLPQGLEATIDVTNLLAQGYRPFLSADGRTLYFAQAPRTVQAGLSFSF